MLERAGLIARGQASASGGPPGSRPGRSRRPPSGPGYRRFWEESYDRLDEYLAELQRQGRRERWAQARNKLMVTTPSDREIVMTRVLDAPRDLVFEAHTSCEHMSKWWGPRMYEVSSCEIDFRTGGAWRIVQRGSEGEEHGFHGEFREVVRPERIVWTFEYEGSPATIGPRRSPSKSRTARRRSRRSTFPTVEERDAMLESGMLEGAGQTYDRLDEYLAQMQGGAASSTSWPR